MGLYVGKTKNPQDAGTPFTAAMFTTASTWVQLNSPWKEKMVKKNLVLKHNGISLSHEINVIRLVAAR